jgi:ribosome-associated protein
MNNPFTDDLDVYVRSILGKKAGELIVLDVRKLSSVADAFIICSGRSNRQVQAIAEHTQNALKKRHLKPLSIEGLQEGHWVLIDYGHVIIHVFYEPVRSFYDLEGLWIDAKRVTTESMKNIPPLDPVEDEFDE